MKLNIKKLREDAILPTYGTEYAAGMDLYSLDDEIITEGETKLIHTGIAVEIPEGYVGLIFARSGLATKKGLAPANKVGVIDSDYRGEIMVALHNHNMTKYPLYLGKDSLYVEDYGAESSKLSPNEDLIVCVLDCEDGARKFIEKGERIAQMVIVPYIHAELNEVDELSDTVRGDGGFGSTGSK